MSEAKGIDRLHKAIQNFVDKNGGRLLIVGDIEVQKWPEDNPLNFRLAVKCTGKPPKTMEGK